MSNDDVTMSESEPESSLGFQLSKTIPTFDTSAVKCISFLSSSSTLLLGSEGGIVTSYNLNESTSYFTNVCHPYAITSLLAGSINENDKEGFIVGSREGYIRMYNSSGTISSTDTSENELKHVFSGHEKSIVSLNWLTNSNSTNNNYIVSSSWDGLAKIWDVSNSNSTTNDQQQKEKMRLEGHENATCSVVLPSSSSDNHYIVTGSAGRHENNQIVDYKLRLWDSKSGKLVQSIKHNHSSSIRCLTSTKHWFASCSNDGTVQLYDNASFHTLESFHTPTASLLLSVASVQNGKYIATCTEDGYVYVWDVVSKEQQILRHPGCVWCIASLPNGDFITGCQDGKARIFTKSPDRASSPIELAEFDTEVQSFHTKTGLSQEEVAKLPTWETEQYNIKGKKEGHVQLFKKQNSTKAIAAQWSQTSQTWIEVGEVTATDNKSSQKGTIDGVTYDYVFPIEIDTTAGTVQTLQIGYNIGDNPFVVAQNFMNTHELNQQYLQQIADYIQKRISDDGAVQLGTTSTPTNTNTTGQQNKVTSFTYLPLKGYTCFDTGLESLSKIFTKILHFQNTKYNSNTGNIIITQEQWSSLQATLQNTSRYHSSKMDSNTINACLPYLRTWDTMDIFPIVDLLRLLVLHPDAACSGSTSKQQHQLFWKQVVELLLEKIRLIQSMPNYTQEKLSCGIILLSLRLICNMFRNLSTTLFTTTDTPSLLSSILQGIQPLISIQFSGSNAKHIRLAIVSILSNITHFLQSTSTTNINDTTPILQMLVQTCKDIITKQQSNYQKDAMIRICMLLGTISIKFKPFCMDTDIKVWISDILVDETDEVFLGIVKELHIVLA